MILFSSLTGIYCHRARLVLAEKGIGAEIVYVDPTDPPEDFLELNPYGNLPSMVDRDLVLYNSRIIMEYLDERFPHPPLHPMDPVSRAQSRIVVYRLKEDWYALLEEIERLGDKKSVKVKKRLRESLATAASIFAAKPYFMSDEFSLIDCALAPLLWRLPSHGIELSKQAEPIRAYAERVFRRPSFQESMSEQERDLVENGPFRLSA
ncbi:MAG: glutathione S-transferase N-terminal domain-containing protein [Pseudomonadota bacterium]|jgi:RNA polymerase-associated protein|nr:glutathione S-transferase N-terminal domain-containing protein [Pseudomonadota bacterium]